METGLSTYGNKFLSKDCKIVDDSSVRNAKLVGIYFSAHWCPPCRNFTPKLVEFYNKTNKNEKVFEVIFVSSDRDENSFKGYFAEMPWLALDFNDPKKPDIKKLHNVSGIPSLVILKPDGSVLDVNARNDVANGESFDDWLKKASQ